MAIVHRAYARVGLLGNPSDGYYGKTISFSLQNFYAEVRLEPSDRICFHPHPVHDPAEFDSLEKLAERTKTEGYYGGVRLLLAICSRLHTYCQEHNLPVPRDRNFTLSYETNIPRQAGLSGSSAIVCAALSCLLAYLGLAGSVPLEDRPSLILSAEVELGITAGLQDRVIQVYGGLVFMDFEREHLERTGNGKYMSLDPTLLPTDLCLVYALNPSDSGKVHSTVKKRWLEGEPAVTSAMAEVAQLAERGRVALERGDHRQLAALMDQNFDLRRRMFGDAALGALNLKMVEVPRSVGAAAKFTGSGGAAIAFCVEGEAQGKALEGACKEAGLICLKVQIAPSNVPLTSAT